MVATLSPDFVDQAIHAASAIHDQEQRYEVLAALAVRLIELGLEWTALDVVEAIADESRRRQALTRMAARVRDDRLPSVLALVHDLAGERERQHFITALEHRPVSPSTEPFVDSVAGDDKVGGDLDPSVMPHGKSMGTGAQPWADAPRSYSGGSAGIDDQTSSGSPLGALSDTQRALLMSLLQGLEAGARRDDAPASTVSSGFAAPNDPDARLDRRTPLGCGRTYYFWLAIEPEARADGMDTVPAELPTALLPDEALLTVAVSGLAGELATVPGQDVGEIVLGKDGSAHVARQAAELPPHLAASPAQHARLLFPVRTPGREGRFRLRCNIYCRDTLVQSRLVTAAVMTQPVTMDSALRADIDYQLGRSLRSATLSSIQPHTLSVLLDPAHPGSHTFSFFGARRFKSEAVLDEAMLGDLIHRARGALRQVAWGSEEPWQDQGYRYASQATGEQLRHDLVKLAVSGYRLYDVLINQLAGGFEHAQALADIMRAPGQIQVVLQRTARWVLPAALIYDQPLDTNAAPDSYSLCSAFEAALDEESPLHDTACFAGACPHHDDELVICPAGFWGYRHALGMPLGTESHPEAAVEIRYDTSLSLSVAVSTDPRLTERPGHEQRLRALCGDAAWRYAATRDEALRLLKESAPHLVYFYCHGGIANRIPYLQVGPRSERGITRDNLRLHRIRWSTTRPLVFLNGCHTTALSPEVTMELVSAFVENAAASGVIGTEITVFEPLACAFAEAFYDHVLDGLSVGEAVRRARLSLLHARNPLGLVYIPYVLASARLQRVATGSP